MNKLILSSLIAAVALSGFAHLATTPSTPESGWTHRWWLDRFDEKKSLAAKGEYEIVFIGDSITHGWERFGKEVWAKSFSKAPYRALNCGFDGDRTEHVLWRLNHGQLAKLSPKVFVLMIGTNNTGHRRVELEAPLDTILGIQSILEFLQSKYPDAKVVLHPIFPRGAKVADGARVRNDRVNEVIQKFADGKRIFWCDFNSRLLTADGTLEPTMCKDLLHPGATGYGIWAESLKPFLDFAMGLSKTAPQPPAPAAPTALSKTGKATTQPSVHFHYLSKERRYRGKRAQITDNPDHYYDVVMLGDSITHFWELKGNNDVFRKRFANYKIMNFAFGGHGTQHVLWDLVSGGCLDGLNTRIVTLMVGTNNAWDSSPEDIAAGITACVKAIRQIQQQATIVLMPILPREVAHDRNGKKFRRSAPNVDEILPKQKRVNELIRPLADGKKVIWLDMTDKFTDAEGLPDIRLLGDGTHPNAAGYEVWADAMIPVFRAILGR